MLIAMGKQQVRIEDIAEALGVSRGTVDRAIHNRGRISEKTKQQVLETARQMGYGDSKLSPLLPLRRSLRAALILPVHPASFYNAIISGAREAAAGLAEPPIALKILQSSEDSEAEQLKILQQLDREIDALILIPRGMGGLSEALSSWKREERNRNKAIVTVNSDLPDSERDCFIGQNLYKSGRIAADLMGKLLPNGELVIITGKRNFFGHEERIRGFQDALREFSPDVRIIEILECRDNEELAEQLLSEQLRNAKENCGVFCTTGMSGLGAARAKQKAGRKRLPIIGYDREGELVRYLKNGCIDFLLSQDPRAQGRLAVETVHQLISKPYSKPDVKRFTKTELLFRELLE